jgi:hypothetical protein
MEGLSVTTYLTFGLRDQLLQEEALTNLSIFRLKEENRLTFPAESHPLVPLFNCLLLNLTEMFSISFFFKRIEGEGSNIMFIYHTSSNINSSEQNIQLDIMEFEKLHFYSFLPLKWSLSRRIRSTLSKDSSKIALAREGLEHKSQKTSFHSQDSC